MYNCMYLKEIIPFSLNEHIRQPTITLDSMINFMSFSGQLYVILFDNYYVISFTMII